MHDKLLGFCRRPKILVFAVDLVVSLKAKIINPIITVTLYLVRLVAKNLLKETKPNENIFKRFGQCRVRFIGPILFYLCIILLNSNI